MLDFLHILTVLCHILMELANLFGGDSHNAFKVSCQVALVREADL
jgi:hypothetical protein